MQNAFWQSESDSRWFLNNFFRNTLMALLATHFLPHFFHLQLNLTYILHLVSVKYITFKSSYNWFKIDIHQQLRPLTANYLAMLKVISTTIYT